VTDRPRDSGRIIGRPADEAGPGPGLDEKELLNVMPADLGAREGREMLRIAGLVRLSFMKLENGKLERLPPRLRRRIIDQAEQILSARHGCGRRRPDRAGLTGWACAAVLALLFVVIRPDQPAPPGYSQTAGIERAGDRMTLTWLPGSQPGYDRVFGTIRWSDSLQAGELRLSGMPPNDPAVAQYQLWIFDPRRDSLPVDGGVFDIPAGAGEIVVPVTARLPVKRPVSFLITREKPGGVVVSDGPAVLAAGA